MKQNELQPTLDNIFQTYKDDSIGRRNDVHSFVRMLNQLDAPCSIMLNGAWGSGKTFFVKQAQLVLDVLNPNSEYFDSNIAKSVVDTWSADKENANFDIEPFVTVYYDAWEHDDEEDPILSIVYEIINGSNGENIPNKKDICNIVASIADAVLSTNISGALQELRGKTDLDGIKNKLILRDQIKEFFSSLLPEKGNKLVIFVDELDRCSPTYAVKLLERIKHYFSLDNVIIVFSINRIELQKTIKKHYGDEFESARYLDRFFQLRLGMPSIDIQKYATLVGLSEYRNVRENVCYEMINRTNMSMREIVHYLAYSKMAANKYTDKSSRDRSLLFDQGYANDIAFCIIVPIMLALSITNPDEYLLFRDGKSSIWLEDILESNSMDGMADLLLDPTESYIDTNGFQTVSRKEKAKIVYELILGHKRKDEYKQGIRVGKAVFYYGIKQRIIDAVNLFSQYTDFSV